MKVLLLFFNQNALIIQVFTNTMEHFAIVRHPIDRLVSGWLEKCKEGKEDNGKKLCSTVTTPGCFHNITCFALKLCERIEDVNTSYFAAHPVDFHFYPQSWFCSFDSQLSKYQLIKYGRDEEFYEQLLSLYKRHGLTKAELQAITEMLKGSTTIHATYQKSNKYKCILCSNGYLLKLIYKSFKTDFDMFNFTVQDFCSAYTHNNGTGNC